MPGLEIPIQAELQYETHSSLLRFTFKFEGLNIGNSLWAFNIPCTRDKEIEKFNSPG